MRNSMIQLEKKQAYIVCTDEMQVLFSYQTPVAARINSVGVIRTEHNWSPTTNNHIRDFMEYCYYPPVQTVPQSMLDNLLRTNISAVTEIREYLEELDSNS